MQQLKDAQSQLDLSRTQVMGILNITPDSFSDGGKLFEGGKINSQKLLANAHAMLSSGATILDIGGESTRPNADKVSENEEMDRVLPALEVLVKDTDAVISIDTSNAKLMTQAAKLGAGMINDVRALERPGALQAACDTGLPICLMHMQGTPQTMQDNPQYSDVYRQVFDYLLNRAKCCEALGVDKNKIVLDPGIGFGKTLQQNLSLIRGTNKFLDSGYPLLLGVSRKSMFGHLLERDVDERLAGGLAVAAYAAMQGVNILRVHDVQETVDVVKVIAALQQGSN